MGVSSGVVNHDVDVLRNPVEFRVQLVGGEVTDDVAMGGPERRKRLAKRVLAAREPDDCRAMRGEAVHESSSETVAATRDQRRVSSEIEEVPTLGHAIALPACDRIGRTTGDGAK